MKLAGLKKYIIPLALFFLLAPQAAFARIGQACVDDANCGGENEICSVEIIETFASPAACTNADQCRAVHAGADIGCNTAEKKCVRFRGVCADKKKAPKQADIVDELSSAVEPTISVPIPGFGGFSGVPIEEDEDGNRYAIFPWIGQYFSAVYSYMLGITGLVVLIVYITAGFEYLTSGGNSAAVGRAKERMKNATIGMLLLFGSHVFLSIINPDLVEFKGLKVQIFKHVPLEFEDVVDGNLGTTKDPIAPLIGSIGELAPDAERCSPEAALAAATALHNLHICVGPCHCAYTASHFLKYIGCPAVQNNGAGTLSKRLEAKGWISQRLDSFSNNSDVPLGLLFQPGHVGVSLGGGKHFQSGGGAARKHAFADGQCPNLVKDAKGTSLCDYCSKIPDEAPRTGRFGKGDGGSDFCKGNQGWAIGNINIKEKNSFRIVISPPSIVDMEAPPLDKCAKLPKNALNAGEVKEEFKSGKMSKVLCEAAKGSWKGSDGFVDGILTAVGTVFSRR